MYFLRERVVKIKLKSLVSEEKLGFDTAFKIFIVKRQCGTITSDHNRTMCQKLTENLSADSLTGFHASECVMYLIFACILIVTPVFNSYPFTCGRDSIAEILVALPQ